MLITHPVRTEEVLLVLHSYGSRTLWNIPGGGFNPKKETPLQAGIREVQEELSVTLAFPRILGTYETTAEGKQDTVTLIAGTLDITETPTLNNEIQEVAWEHHTTVVNRTDVARVARRAIRLLYGDV